MSKFLTSKNDFVAIAGCGIIGVVAAMTVAAVLEAKNDIPTASDVVHFNNRYSDTVTRPIAECKTGNEEFMLGHLLPESGIPKNPLKSQLDNFGNMYLAKRFKDANGVERIEIRHFRIDTLNERIGQTCLQLK